MITKLQHTKDVQNRRMRLGKRGYAKAVRRFLKRECPDTYLETKSILNVCDY